MFRSRITAFCLLALVAGANFGHAQRVKVTPRRDAAKPPSEAPKSVDAPPAEPQRETQPPEPAFNPFGDASKFTRFGGWGGIGATMGQFGMARSMLIMLPAVQAELELTDEQKKALREWQEEMRDRGREMGEQMRAQGEQNMRQLNVAGALEMIGRMNELMQENERGFGKILTAGQRKRLDQISLQMEGVTALARPDVAQRLKLTDEQLEQIQLIIAQSRFKQIGYWLGQANTMRNNRERDRDAENSADKPEAPSQSPPADKEDTDADSKPASTKDNAPPRSRRTSDDDLEDADVAKRRKERRERMRKQFETMRAGADQIQDDTVQAILKVLVPRQRAAFDRLLGPPFDPTKALSGINPRRESQSRESSAPLNVESRPEREEDEQ
jgi:hypothetical protein